MIDVMIRLSARSLFFVQKRNALINGAGITIVEELTYKCREYVAMGTARIAFEKGMHNLSDCLTKFLGSDPFGDCIRSILHR